MVARGAIDPVAAWAMFRRFFCRVETTTVAVARPVRAVSPAAAGRTGQRSCWSGPPRRASWTSASMISRPSGAKMYQS